MLRPQSNNGRDLKGTKTKGKVQGRSKRALEVHGSSAPVAFDEAFSISVPRDVTIGESCRLHIMVWDRAQLSTNDCTGGMSFSIPEIMDEEGDDKAWYFLLPVHLARAGSLRADAPQGWGNDQLDAYDGYGDMSSIDGSDTELEFDSEVEALPASPSRPGSTTDIDPQHVVGPTSSADR